MSFHDFEFKIRFLFHLKEFYAFKDEYHTSAIVFQCFSSSGRRTDRVSDVEPHEADGPTVHGRAQGLPTRQEISPPGGTVCGVGETWRDMGA